MRNVSKVFLAACIAATALTFTSCRTEESGIAIITYSASGDISASGSGGNILDALFVITEYNSAIKTCYDSEIFSSKEIDAQIISVCDKVYQTHKENAVNATGYVEIKKTVGASSVPDADLPSKTIKRYEYPAR